MMLDTVVKKNQSDARCFQLIFDRYVLFGGVLRNPGGSAWLSRWVPFDGLR
jgi:hypothetical protein